MKLLTILCFLWILSQGRGLYLLTHIVARGLCLLAPQWSISLSPCAAVAEVTFSLQHSGEVTIADNISGVGMALVLRYEGPKTLDGSWSKDLWNGHEKSGKRDKPTFPKNPFSIPVYPNKSERPTYVSLNSQMLMIKTRNLWMSYKSLFRLSQKWIWKLERICDKGLRQYVHYDFNTLELRITYT